jgi:hypothetical protein
MKVKWCSSEVFSYGIQLWSFGDCRRNFADDRGSTSRDEPEMLQ